MKLLFTITATLIFCLNLAAQEDVKSNILSVNLGAYIPTSDFKDVYEDVDMGTSFAMSGSYQHYLTRTVGIGASMLITVRDTEEDGRYAIYDIEQGIFFISLLGVKRFLISPKLDIYVQGGPSLVINTLNYSGDETTHGTMGFTLGAGSRYYLAESFFLGLEAGYNYAKVKYEFDTAPSSMEKRQDLGGFTLGVSAGIAF